jgi:hypothetical protein
MSEPADPGNTIPRATPQMETGSEVLEEWTETAGQADRNAVHKALFAMQDGSLFHTYRVVADVQLPNELYVIVKDDLVLKLRVNSRDSFDVVGIGPRDHFTTQYDDE